MLRQWRSYAESSADIALRERGHAISSSEGVCYEAERLMPELIREMREDVHRDETELVRSFWLKRSRGTVINRLDEVFHYDQQAHPHLYNDVAWLAQMGLVTQERFDPTVPRYRLNPEFHRWLRETDTA